MSFIGDISTLAVREIPYGSWLLATANGDHKGVAQCAIKSKLDPILGATAKKYVTTSVVGLKGCVRSLPGLFDDRWKNSLSNIIRFGVEKTVDTTLNKHVDPLVNPILNSFNLATEVTGKSAYGKTKATLKGIVSAELGKQLDKVLDKSSKLSNPKNAKILKSILKSDIESYQKQLQEIDMLSKRPQTRQTTKKLADLEQGQLVLATRIQAVYRKLVDNGVKVKGISYTSLQAKLK